MSSAQATVVADRPAEIFPWGEIRWLCNRALVGAAHQTFGVCEILPGQRNALHYHPNCDELLYVIAGECDHSHDGAWSHLKPGMLIHIPAGVRHSLVNTGSEPVRCVISFSSPDRETVFLE